mmetsp:Transcript_22880/g.31286  ORF Transcript_22880/g.31286 Transcript_22880/m.31286 type:complete len:94 (+) Transcript_22880:653-934(+)
MRAQKATDHDRSPPQQQQQHPEEDPFGLTLDDRLPFSKRVRCHKGATLTVVEDDEIQQHRALSYSPVSRPSRPAPEREMIDLTGTCHFPLVID